MSRFCAMQYLGLSADRGGSDCDGGLHDAGHAASNGWRTSRCAQAPSLAVLITAIGMSYLLQNLALLIWGSNPKSFTSAIIDRLPVACSTGSC